jgi:site-specific recombinase XerD
MSLKSFFAWMVQDRRLPSSPLTHLCGGNVKTDRRHDRQTLSEDQLSAIIRATSESKKTFRGLTGTDRGMIYLTAMTTGFRAEEMASLSPESFHLDTDTPVAGLAARVTKNRRGATQPLSPEAADELRR